MPLPPHAQCRCPQPLLSAPPCKPCRTTAWQSFLGSAGRASRPAVAPPATYLVAGPPAGQSTRHSPRVVPRLLNTPVPRPPASPGERAQRGSATAAQGCVSQHGHGPRSAVAGLRSGRGGGGGRARPLQRRAVADVLQHLPPDGTPHQSGPTCPCSLAASYYCLFLLTNHMQNELVQAHQS